MISPYTTFDNSSIDGPPEPVGPLARYPAGPNLFPRLSAGATVFLDDAVREDEKRIADRWMKEYSDLQRKDHPCEKGCVAFRSMRSSIARPGSNG